MFDHLPPPAPVVVIDGNIGGFVDGFVRDIETYRRRGVVVHVKGACMSACTMVLALKRTCVEPGASFSFHQAFPVYPDRPPDVTDRDETATGIVWDHYPRAVRAWINRHGGLTGTLITLQGAELSGVVPACQRPSQPETASAR